ncbi:MAG: hypothetical protein RLZZ316_2347 [Bacteroidota bacterium]
MRKKLFALTGVAAISIFFISWGTWGHQHINRAAIFALPETMRVFYYNHIDFITEESVIPDTRKFTNNDKVEAQRHFIDLENFIPNPGDTLPQTMQSLTGKYNNEFLTKNGILPWHMEDVMNKLTNAFKERRKADILLLSGDLGHYIADAHMPLHTTVNYDGQATNQRGIHSFWESQVPELLGSNYNFNVTDAVYIIDVRKEIWNIINNSHGLIDSLLAAEKKIAAVFGNDKMYVRDSAGKVVKNKFGQWIRTKEYAKAYHDALNGMVEQQLRLSIAATANFWYTAWVNAGSPDITSLDAAALTKRNSKNYKADLKMYKKGKLFGIKNDNEF